MAASPEDRTLEDAFGNCDLSIVEDDALDKFLAVQSDKTSLCILTSGGSQVALEKRAVRTLENFSTGNRGARCVEAFLDLAQTRRYSVILLTRTGATLPYARAFSVSSFADAEEFQPTERGALLENAEAATACSRLRQVLDEQRLFVAEYTTVQEYLFSLRHIARKCKNVQRRAMFCLAAAVSDFYIPASEMAEHKIQTSDGSLTLTLRPVPKCLGLLTSTWASHAFFVSFKLETDPGILKSKAEAALRRYRTHAVVGNILETRYKEVTLVSQGETKVLRPLDAGIDDVLVRELVRRHAEFLDYAASCSDDVDKDCS